MNKVNILHNLNRTPGCKCKALIIKAVNHTLQNEKVYFPCEVNILITDNKTIRKYNRKFRGIDRPTDVLSFPMQSIKSPVDKDIHLLGDVIISMQMIHQHALEYGNPVKHETTHMIVHSILHLLGYDHKNTRSEQIMQKKERKILNDIGYTKQDDK